VLTLAISPTPQTLVKVAQKIDEDNERVLMILLEVLGIRSPQSAVHVKLEPEENISNHSAIL
jgi:hypothetical protein